MNIMFQLLSTIGLKFGICLYNVKKYAQQYIENINKNIANNFLITTRRRTRTILFQKLPSPAPAPESENALVLHSQGIHSAVLRFPFLLYIIFCFCFLMLLVNIFFAYFIFLMEQSSIYITLLTYPKKEKESRGS